MGWIIDNSASVSGPYTVTVTADDGFAAPVSTTLSIDVTNPDPISIANHVDDFVDGATISIDANLLIVDPDSDVLSWSSPDLPVWLSLDPLSAMITGTVPIGSEAAGSVVFSVIANDGQGGSVGSLVTLNPAVLSPSQPGTESLISTQLFPDETDNGPESNRRGGEPTAPFVVDAVNQIQALDGTGVLENADGIVVKTVDELNELNSTGSADSADPAVLKAVEAIEALRKIHLEQQHLEGSTENSWDVEGLTGFSLKFGWDDAAETGVGDNSDGQLIIETYVRNRILFIDVNNSFDPQTQGSVLKYHVSMIDGSPLPDWIRVVRDGFIVAERPANLWDMELKITAEMENGRMVSRGVLIDGPTGEIQPRDLVRSPDDFRSFSTQLSEIAREIKS